MKAIINTGPNRLEWLDLPLPQPAAGQARIRTGACAICATDLLMIAGWERTGFPAVPGHEWSGTVDAVGPGVDENLVGRRCVAENVLPGGDEVGFERPGGYGEFFLTQAASILPLPQSFALPAAALTEPLAVCLRGLRRLRSENVSRALVTGDGPIGLLVLMLLKRSGVQEVVMLGGRSGRLALARQLGASLALDFRELGEDQSGALLRICGQPFPVVVEASGSAIAANACLGVVANSGRMLVLGDYGPARFSLAWNDLLHREIELAGSNSGGGAWEEAARMVVDGALPLDALITHRFPAHAFAEAINTARSQQEDVVKVVLEWETSD
jgi:threonine dehydrogenase-like Zn-dependent dehydrogenase